MLQALCRVQFRLFSTS